MTNYLNKRLHAELAARGLTGDKKEYAIYGFTNGRTSSSADLSDAEAREFINSLPAAGGKDNDTASSPAKWQPPTDEADKRRKQILAIGYGIGWTKEKTIDWATADGTKFNDIPLEQLRKKIGALQKIKKQTT